MAVAPGYVLLLLRNRTVRVQRVLKPARRPSQIVSGDPSPRLRLGEQRKAFHSGLWAGPAEAVTLLGNAVYVKESCFIVAQVLIHVIRSRHRLPTVVLRIAFHRVFPVVCRARLEGKLVVNGPSRVSR